MSPYAIMTDVAACLCATIDEYVESQEELDLDFVIKSPCFCGVVPGATAVADFFPECTEDKSDGMAWVRLAASYPASGPGVMEENPRMMGATSLGFDIEVGILRSIPLDPQGNTGEEFALATEQQLLEMKIMRQAVQCCSVLKEGDYLLTTYTPIGPIGGVVGGSWTVMLHPLADSRRMFT